MTELQIFAEVTLNHGGEWWLLEESKSYSLYGCKTKFTVNHQTYYNPPVYQVFNGKGKRIYASTNYREAYNKYKELTKNAANTDN